MILVDANLLVYAHVASTEQHVAARTWLDDRINNGGRGPERSVEPFVRGIECGDGNVEEAQSADCPVSAAGPDVDGRKWPDRIPGAVQFDFTLALEYDVDLGHDLVIVGAGVRGDVDQVNAGCVLSVLSEGPSRGTAWTGHASQFIQLGDGRVVRGMWGHDQSRLRGG